MSETLRNHSWVSSQFLKAEKKKSSYKIIFDEELTSTPELSHKNKMPIPPQIRLFKKCLKISFKQLIYIIKTHTFNTKNLI